MRSCSALTVAGLLSCAAVSLAADWPQWRGPDRNEVSADTKLLTKFPAGGPKVLWSAKNVGVGYSGPAIVGNRLYTLGADENENREFALCIDTNSGKELWRTNIGKYKDSGYTDRWGGGPRSTPTVDGKHLYVLGVNGDLVCLTTDGKVIWHKNLIKEHNGQMMSGWGYSESPLVDGNQVVVTPGGSGGAMAAFDKMSGKLLWRSKGAVDTAAYSSIVTTEIDGVKQYVNLTGTGVIGISTQGETLWTYKREGHRTAVIPTAICKDNYVYVTAGYGCGCDLIKIVRDGGKFKAEKVYANKNMVNHHGGVVRVGGFIYGFSDGRGWVCQDFMTGENRWEEKGKGAPGKGSVTYADGHLYCYDESDGKLVVAVASPSGWKETGRFSLPQKSNLRKPSGKIWTHPVIANGKLYLRDQELLFCFDVAAK